MSKKEEHLYPDIEKWLSSYLKDKYKGYTITTTHKTSRQFLDVFLNQLGINISDAIGLSIKVDIVGVLQRGKSIKLVLIEVKDKQLTLKDLGQLWGYSQLIDPVESFLISSVGLGSLDYLLKVRNREDLLRYGKKKEKMMKVCQWDSKRKSIDYKTLLPKM